VTLELLRMERGTSFHGKNPMRFVMLMPANPKLTRKDLHGKTPTDLHGKTPTERLTRKDSHRLTRKDSHGKTYTETLTRKDSTPIVKRSARKDTNEQKSK